VKRQPQRTELEVLSEEEATPVASSDHKALFGSKVKPVARQPDKIASKAVTVKTDLPDMFGPT
jgi:hypothetical protein